MHYIPTTMSSNSPTRGVGIGKGTTQPTGWIGRRPTDAVPMPVHQVAHTNNMNMNRHQKVIMGISNREVLIGVSGNRHQ